MVSGSIARPVHRCLLGVALVALPGCGLTLDLTPADDGGGGHDAAADAGRGDAGRDGSALDAGPGDAGGADGGATVMPRRTAVTVTVEPPPFDVHVNLDSTGSMQPVLTSLQTAISPRIAPGVRALLPEAAFGFSTFDDFPLGVFGGDIDRPFRLRQRITSDVSAIQSAIDATTIHYGNDGPESGLEALYQIATGAGVAWTYEDESTGQVPAVDCSAGFDPGLAHGQLGGACFRREALPVVVHITDNRSHTAEEYAAGMPPIPGAATTPDTFAALGSLAARVVGIWTQTMPPAGEPTDPRYPEGMARRTGAVVPPCAFDAVRDAACPPGSCCTGLDGAGVAAADGTCALAYQTDGGNALPRRVIDAVRQLHRFVRLELAVALEDVTGDPVDARCFVQSVELAGFTPSPRSCAVAPRPEDRDGDGLDDTLADATPATQAEFELVLANADTRDLDGDGNRAEPCAAAGTYDLVVRVLGDGRYEMGSRNVTVTVE